MVLTNRDLRLLALTARMALLTTSQIASEVFSGVALVTVLRRLRVLEMGKYIERVEGLPNRELAWCLTLKGAEAVCYENPKRHFHRLNLVHDTKLSGLRLLFENQGIARSWMPEHEIRSSMARKHGLERMKSKSVPDGIMGVDYEGVMESVAIELELHYKNRNRYRDIFWSYRGKPNLKAVWYFVPKKSFGEHLCRLWSKSVGQNQRPRLLWSLIEDVERNGSKARLHWFDTTFVIEELFTKKLEIIGAVGAQEPGCEVSRQVAEKSELKSDLTPENEKELLVNAS